MTMTEAHRPSQFGGQKTRAENEFDEVMESIKDVIPLRVANKLDDLSGDRALDAYDCGVLGKLLPDDLTVTSDVATVVTESLEALSRFVRIMADRA